MFFKRISFAFVCLVFSAFTAAAAPDIVLLKRYSQDIDPTGWLMSEKLDGVRAVWDGERLVSRNGNAFAAPSWFTDPLPPFAIDGELWTQRADFDRIQSITSRDQPHAGWRAISYNVFEVPGAEGGLLERLGNLQAWLDANPVTHLRVIEQTPVRDRAHLKQTMDAVIAGGGEGLVLRKPEVSYRSGRDDSALKLKRFQDAEALVIGYRAGKGRLKGMTGALQVETADGRRFFVGSGLSDAQRANPPAIGSTITFRFQGLTKNGLPRFPVFLRERLAH